VSASDRNEIAADTDFYRATPKLKPAAELGPKFDIRDFHARVLMTGSLPLAILERKVDAWIAAKKAS